MATKITRRPQVTWTVQATRWPSGGVACDYCGREVTAGICAEPTEAADQIVAVALRRAPNTDKE
jgi:hypothetical protein